MPDAPAMTARFEELLSRFPGPLILHPPRETWATRAAGSLLFAIVGGFLILDDGVLRLWGWIDVIFFSACLVVSAARLLPGAAALTLDLSGFEEQTLFVQRRRAQWRDVTSITADAASVARSGVTLVRYRSRQAKRSVLPDTEATLPSANGRLTETYGLSAEALAELMTRWQHLALEAERLSRDRVDRLI